MKEYEAEFDLCPFCGYIKDTPAKSRNHLEPGTEIANRYIIGKSLGQGGFGITYIAWDNKIQKTVTIKEFFPNALSTRGSGEVSVSCFNDRAEAHFKEGMKKMLDEGRRLSKFTDNENIVDVYDFFEENNTSYIVMEYLSGKDLKQFLEEKGGKLDPEEAVKIILPILNALSDMHKAQLIHRDVAPDNIFLCDNGKIKLLDFGSARLAVDENEKSLSIMLKHGFAPKEQYSSRSNQGPWTDVYAVCATLYKMITGEVPPDSIDRKSDSLKPLSAFGINGYAALEEVISKGLEVEQENRYQDVKSLQKELVSSLKKKNSITAKTPTKTNNTNSKNNSKKIIIAAVAAIVLVAGLVSGTVFANKFKKDETNATTESSTSENSTTTNNTASTLLETTTEISTTEDISAQQQKLKEIKEKAVKAYEKELSELSDYLSSVYITDINQDGIPEVIYRLLSGQGAMTYTEKHGLSTVDFSGHSSMNPEIYISNENCIYFRDDGHNQGTAWYHHAEFYSINETGFVKTHEIDGEEWEDFDWNNEELFEATDKKYEKEFEKKLNAIIKEQEFNVYSKIANDTNTAEYLSSELSINISNTEKIRQIYEYYLNSTSAQKYYEPPIEETDLGLYYGNKYNGKKELTFLDIDADGTEECILKVPFPSNTSLSYEIVYIFDIEDEIVRLVFSSLDCGVHRAQGKFSIIKYNGKYMFHSYYVDPHELWGSIYSYDGTKIELNWSYDAEDLHENDEDKVITSQIHDFVENYGIDYLKMYYNNEPLPEYIITLSKPDFNKVYNQYLDSSLYKVPQY